MDPSVGDRVAFNGEFEPDPHAPFTALSRGGDGFTWCVVDDREGEDAGPLVVFRGRDAVYHALRYEEVRNRAYAGEHPANEDGPTKKPSGSAATPTASSPQNMPQKPAGKRRHDRNDADSA